MKKFKLLVHVVDDIIIAQVIYLILNDKLNIIKNENDGIHINKLNNNFIINFDFYIDDKECLSNELEIFNYQKKNISKAILIYNNHKLNILEEDHINLDTFMKFANDIDNSIEFKIEILDYINNQDKDDCINIIQDIPNLKIIYDDNKLILTFDLILSREQEYFNRLEDLINYCVENVIDIKISYDYGSNHYEFNSTNKKLFNHESNINIVRMYLNSLIKYCYNSRLYHIYLYFNTDPKDKSINDLIKALKQNKLRYISHMVYRNENGYSLKFNIAYNKNNFLDILNGINSFRGIQFTLSDERFDPELIYNLINCRFDNR